MPWRHPKLRDRTLVAGSREALPRHRLEDWLDGRPSRAHAGTPESAPVRRVFHRAPFQEALARYLVTDDAKTHLRELGPIYQAKRDSCFKASRTQHSPGNRPREGTSKS